MQVIGFNLTKILAERDEKFIKGSINTNIEFSDVKKETVELMKDAELSSIEFKFTINYAKPGNEEEVQGFVKFEGRILLATDKEQAKELAKSWKKKEIPEDIKIPLFNIILKKCSTKALMMEEDLNLPNHMPFPQIKRQTKST